MEKQIQSAEGAKRETALLPFDRSAFRLAVWPMEFWLQWQADMMKTAASVTTDWLSRRREGAESALRALERLSACHDVNEASKVQREWIADEAERLGSDMRALSDSKRYSLQESAKASRHTAETRRAP